MIKIEMTDTFGGETNYSWVTREEDKTASMKINSYIKTALWSSTAIGHPDEDENFDKSFEQLNYDISDCSPDMIRQSTKDCMEFYKEAEKAGIDLDSSDYKNWQHDFWLTRNGHGAGFWDGDYPDHEGKILTKISKSFGEVNLFLNDDDKIEIM